MTFPRTTATRRTLAVTVVRRLFDRGGRQRSRRLLPQADKVRIRLTVRLDVPYGPETAMTLDIFSPVTPRSRPVVVWIHGGGWISGDKSDVAPYLRLLAAEGFVTVAVNYGLAPAYHYPAPVAHVAAALRHLIAHATAYGIDPGRFVLAGDSAGAHVAAQLAAAVTDPAYATDLGIDPVLAPNQLRAIVLCCGPYDLGLVAAQRGAARQVLRIFAEAYAGRVGVLDGLTGDEPFSVAQRVTSAFPPSLITVGNGDSLEPHSRLLAERLAGQGVPVETIFYPPTHRPRVPHEYQFDLRRADARLTFDQLVGFIRRRG